MATLNTSSEGQAITRSYESIVNAPIPSGPAASSPTHGQWAIYSVQAPLASAFQQDSGKDSVLKVFRTGEGELVDLIDEFSEGKIQFALVKVKDPNTKLAKSVLIAWCGEGVPERTKGYFTSHLAAVSKLLHGYHVQVTARTDSDLTPDGIIKKVADASGSKYSGDSASSPSAGGPPPPVASKPVFTPSRMGGGAGGGGFNPLASRAARAAPQGNTDEDGWGEDAPQVTRSQIEKVQSAYKPTKVNMAELQSQKEPSRFNAPPPSQDRPDVVRGTYQPVGKVDIAALRRQAQESGDSKDDRPAAVKGSHEPVGKVDIAAIRARAQPPASASSPPPTISPARTGASNRSSEMDQSERMTSMPKPKSANKFGSSANSFGGTKAPLPGGYDKPAAPAAPVGTASKTFADEGGKTPAQVWAEKKARERGNSGAAEAPNAASPMASQTSGGGQWESGYSGKKWGAVQIPRASQAPVGDVVRQNPSDDQPTESTSVSSVRDRFKEVPPMGGATRHAEDEDEDDATPAPPPMDMSSKPNAGASRGVPMPGLPSRPAEPVAEDEAPRMPTPPAQPPRSPTPPTPEVEPSSPIRIAQPVARDSPAEMEPPEERNSQAVPHQSLSEAVPVDDDLEDEPQISRVDTARAAAATTAESTFSPREVAEAPNAASGGKRAVAQYDYEKAEENELELKEGEMVTNIDMVDEDWWMGQNAKGEAGLFPSNYVELVEDETGHTAPAPAHADPAAAPPSQGPTATAQYDYEAAEENELSFPDGAKIINVEQPDPDWWAGEYQGKTGLFPANYVTLDD
ncbi:MAG: hypothetical protein M1828_006348 [Chrysothrix sp. TS-e1954]|nr:MAG: hypothetical protein M1828_006348 [Chrysothrix sp. TS-e1954]